ncbi:hypothetical protein GQ53DRAFT_752110 [Thozetella sp. PMI_491]|nr:hypothetical protein GQ53DRAFT_752110 [Thozetella sp. PMI_491]
MILYLARAIWLTVPLLCGPCASVPSLLPGAPSQLATSNPYPYTSWTLADFPFLNTKNHETSPPQQLPHYPRRTC